MCKSKKYYITKIETRKKTKKPKSQHIRAWTKENPKFVRIMNDTAFEIAKGSWKPNDKFNVKLVKEMLEDCGLTVDFTAAELLQEWRRL